MAQTAGTRPPKSPRRAPDGDAFPTRAQVSTACLVVLTALTVYLGWRLLAPFVATLVWAVALAVVTRPMHLWIRARVHRPGLAAGLAVLLVALLIVAPVAFVGQQLFSQATKGIDTLKQELKEGRWRQALERNPQLAPVLKTVEERGGSDGASQAVTAAAAKVPRFLGITARGAMEAAIAMFALFFFFRDEDEALRLLRSLLPLRRREATRLLKRVHDTIWATIFGTVVMGAVQGLLGGLMFWWLGVPAPALWGLVMAFLAIIPVLGAFIVWMPVAAMLALQGEWAKAVILAAWGAIVVSASDNVLYPVLVGKRMRMHTLPVFVSLLGGLSLCGAVGIVVGPVALAVGMELLRIWRRRTRPAAAAAA